MGRELRLNPPRLFLLRRWALVLRARFDAHVHLVGSALRDDNHDPRDWDVRVLLTYEQFAARYAPARMRKALSPRDIARLWNEQYFGRSGDDRSLYWGWLREPQAVGKEAYEKSLRLNVDFQAYPPNEWAGWRGHPRWKITGRARAARRPS